MLITTQTTQRGTEQYVIRFDRFRRQVIDKLKADITVYGRYYDPKTSAWIVPATNESKRQLEQFTYYVKHFENVNWGKQPEERKDIPAVPELPELNQDHCLKINPYNYQTKGIARGLELKRFINGDDMGLGKTMQAIATINIANAFPCLVICPNVVKINWQREWTKFTDKNATVMSESIQDTWPFFWHAGMHQIFITNYESLKKYFVRKINKAEKWTLKDVVFRDNIKLFKSVIIDESHKVKSTAVQQSKFCKGIADGKEYIILLTGTPVVNKPKDLVSQLGIMNRMNDLGGWKYFTGRYCAGPNEASNLKELNYHLWNKCFFRREKHEVLKELPEMTRQILQVDIDNRNEYNVAENDLIIYMKKYKEADDEKIQRSLRGEVMVRISFLRDITARGKLKNVIDFIDDFLESGKKIVIFCNLHDIVDRLVQTYPKAVCITGRQNGVEKQASIDAFAHNPSTNIAICSIKAAGAGVDGLQTACNDVLFIEEPWTAADRNQAESRVHRNGLKDGATMYHMLGRNTIDMKMWKIIESKAAISNAIMGSTEYVDTKIVDMICDLFNKSNNED